MRWIGLFLAFCSLAFSTQYYSQCGQDRFIYENFFKECQNGFFIEIGAFDGVFLSNTYFFEQHLGWNGICIEPIPELYEKLRKNRKCQCICGCIAKEHDVEKEFLHVSGPLEGLSGLVDKYHPRHLNRIKREMAVKQASCQSIKVRCYNLNFILEEANINHVHFLSIDTEGGEFEILQSIDFSKYQIDVIAVEDNYGDKRIVPFLNRSGFSLVKVIEQDLIFLHENFLLR